MTRQHGPPGGRPSSRRPRPAASSSTSHAASGGDSEELAELLERIDGDGYPAYRRIEGRWVFPHFTLTVRRAQPDPYAPPSRVEVQIGDRSAGLPSDLWDTPDAARATSAHLLRRFAAALSGGPFTVDVGGPEILDRSSGRILDGAVTLCLALALPGRGRRIDGRAARRALTDLLPTAVDAVRGESIDLPAARRVVATVADAVALREMLPELGLIAFVADGAILPRRSGVSEEPMSTALPFRAPESMAVRVRLPYRGEVTGLGIPEGVTVVVGGGFHGKSTLVRAIERGVYDHLPGDGRELVVTRADAVKIRAEDGRSVTRLDLGAFLSTLPNGATTADFCTADASGSTSQAASIVEALEVGSRALLIDEDTAATNIMIRDARMRALVSAEHEPLTPLLDLIRSLWTDHGTSTIVVTGGTGDYLAVADHVVMMDAYQPREVTERARLLAGDRATEDDRIFPPVRARRPLAESIDAAIGGGRRRVRARGLDVVLLGEEEIDVRLIEQLVDPAQLVGVGLALAALGERGRLDGTRTLREALTGLAAEIAERGPSALAAGFPGDLAVPRMFEVAAALNRLRTLRIADPVETAGRTADRAARRP
ncbi:ABC-ATPase domain-containing protein [Actinoalloteichus hymeniacidonis]|uniref:ATPase of the ABC class n=1 Tax=Actinoalloteichus hymeniacidonis TaxID=340345 RepID=A0AAC9HQ61_9PSEU|nr:ABC-ATPase domain-containing protein [Actinoalloteichus hymeniacidonis]AOS63281.1 putative ATPase of the ABC class [Actinoalloteichus hymeniacidonis]MBB5908680.1 putative ABC-class ATPase [Actinoalloteichus hymeniacidonis]